MDDGARELDVVVNIGKVLSKQWSYVADDIRALRVEDGPVHLARLVLEDAQLADLAGHPLGVCHRVALRHAEEDAEAGADLPDDLPIHRDARLADPLHDGAHRSCGRGSAHTLLGSFAGLLIEPLEEGRHVVGVLLLLLEDLLDEPARGRIVVAEVANHVEVRLDGDALGDEVLLDHVDQ